MINIKIIKKKYKLILILIVILSLSIVNAAYTQELTIRGEGKVLGKKTLDGTNNKCEIIKGTGTSIGDEVKCGTEPFYVIQNTNTKITLFAKYNLEVGYDYVYVPYYSTYYYELIEHPSGIQNSRCGFSNMPTCRTHTDNYPSPDLPSLYDAMNTYKAYLINTVGLNNVTVSNVDFETLILAGCDIKWNTDPGYCGYPEGACTNTNFLWLYNTDYPFLSEKTNKYCAPYGIKKTGKIAQFLNGKEEEGGLRVYVEITK